MAAGTSRRVAIALGSNLGDRQAALAFAAGQLSAILGDVLISASFETEPVGAGLEEQPRYLNAALTGNTDLPAAALLAILLRIERDFGRERPHPNAPRTLDLDLILAGADIIAEDGLTVPHPRFRNRMFVLEPLAQVGADLTDPVTEKSVGQLLQVLRAT